MQVGYSLLITEFPRSDINVFPDSILCVLKGSFYMDFRVFCPKGSV